MNGPDASTALLVLDEPGDLVPRLAPAIDGRFRLFTAGTREEAVAAAREGRVHVMVVNHREGAAAVATLQRVRAESPDTVAIVLAGHAERPALLASADEGAIFRMAHRPGDLEQLQGFIALAADQARAVAAAAAPTDHGKERSCVLVLDEDTATAERVREALSLAPGGRHAVHWCDSLYEAFDALAHRPVGLLVSDVRLDGEDISGGLRTLRACHPEVATLIFSSVKDTSGFADLLAGGCLWVSKPAGRERLAGALAAALNPLASVLFEPSRVAGLAGKRVPTGRGFMGMLRRRLEAASGR